MIKVTRIGFVNFWLFDDEEFDFYDGKLLLRGHNGAGKSITMQSFIPLILDGNKSPARLDPFGTTDKHIEDYVLGGIDTEKKEEATSYLYMEVFHEEKQKYITIGMGLHGRQGRQVEFYGFSIVDGRRIGRDLFLYNNEKVPLTKQELKLTLGSENTIVEKTSDYKKMVNNLLFGFESPEAYDEFINVLLQLRSPKLSKDFKPTKLMGILSTVLQPLTEEDLRSLTDAIEEMDKTKEKLSKLEEDSKQISYFLKTFNNYNEILLYQKSKNYLEKEKLWNDTKNALKENGKTLERLKEDLEGSKEASDNLAVEQERLHRQKENIDNKDLNAKSERKAALLQELETNEKRVSSLEESMENKREKQKEAENSIRKIQEEIAAIEKELESSLREINALSDEIKWNEIRVALKDLQEDKFALVDLTYLETRLKNYQNTLKTIKEKLKQKKEEEQRNSVIEEEIMSITKEYQRVLEALEKQEEKIEEELSIVKDQIRAMNRNHQFIKLTEEEKTNLFSYLKMYERNSFGLARDLYEKIANTFSKAANKEYYGLVEKKNKEQEKKAELEKVLEEMKLQEEEEIILDEEETKTKEFMIENNIKHLEFYKAIDFKENLKEEEKDALEQILLSSSLLNAYIIDKKDTTILEGHKGVFLCKSAKKKKNLTEYLKVVEQDIFKKIEIENILESISTDELENYYLTPNKMQMDYMISFGSKNIPSKYIGVLKRKEEKARRIKKQEEKIREITNILNNIETLLEKKRQELETIEKETKDFPSEESLKIEEEKRISLETTSKVIAKQKEEKEQKQKEVLEKIEYVVKELNGLKKEVQLPLSYEVFENAIESTNDLSKELANVKLQTKTFSTKKEMMDSNESRIEELQSEIDTIYEDIHELSQKIKTESLEIKDLEEILNSKEYKDLANTLEEISKRLILIPKEIQSLSEKMGAIKSDIKNTEEKRTELEKELAKEEKVKELYKIFFQEEYNLHYCFEEENLANQTLAKTVLSKLAHRKDNDKNQAFSNFISALNQYRINLNDYNISQIQLFENIDDEEYREYCKENERSDIRAMYQGKQLNIYELSRTLINAIEETHFIMTDQDQRLFEEILLESVGKKIKERIISSQDWVKKINDIMEVMQRDSALSFGLKWKEKDAESLDEIDTKELVRIFKAPEGMERNQKDVDNLVKHFRSKLQKAMEYIGETANYGSVIFDVLDYRNWFEFKMTYQRKGEQKKELTDKIFSVFSGGEKAKTMYIPLFAAVSAKLNSAKEHTLRLVALDEAFAGVDESNIKEMFGILDSLELDYILTSQALTGDYDTIKELAIAELLRPNNAQVVAIKRKKWNGKTMETILRKEITKDAVDLF